jgi:cytochrome P450
MSLAAGAGTTPSSARQVPLFNPRDPAFLADPYPIYRRMRDEDPVHRSFMGAWVVTRYEHVKLVQRERRFSAPDIPSNLRRKNEFLKRRFPGGEKNLDSLELNLRYWFALLEDPDHARLRGLVARTFHKRSAESLRAVIEDCSCGLIERARARGEMDLIADFAAELPTRVIARILGIEDEHLPQVFEWVQSTVNVLDPLQSIDAMLKIEASSRAFMAFVYALVQERRARPRADLITALVEARDDRSALSDEEIVSTCIQLFLTGEQTMIGLISNGMLALLRHPDEMQRLRRDLGLLPTAIEELLRYDASMQMGSRHLAQDVELEGKLLRKGDQIYFVQGSANRDPRKFVDPDRLDLSREYNPHMSLGEGRHYCVGAMLARLEAGVAFSMLLERLPNLRLADVPLKYDTRITLRRLLALPLRF